MDALASIWLIMMKLDYCLVFKMMGNCSIGLSKFLIGMGKMVNWVPTFGFKS